MKRYLALLLFLFLARVALAQVTVTGNVTDAGGNPATSGYVQFDIQPRASGVQYFVPSVAAIAPQTTQCGISTLGLVLNLALTGPCKVWGNDVITPGNTLYKVTFAPGGNITNAINNELITGSTYNLNNPIFAQPVQTSPQQAIIFSNPFQTNILPIATNTYNIGSPLMQYAAVYASQFFLNGAPFSTVPGGTPGQLQFNNTGILGGVPLTFTPKSSGNCVLSTLFAPCDNYQFPSTSTSCIGGLITSDPSNPTFPNNVGLCVGLAATGGSVLSVGSTNGSGITTTNNALQVTASSKSITGSTSTGASIVATDDPTDTATGQTFIGITAQMSLTRATGSITSMEGLRVQPGNASAGGAPAAETTSTFYGIHLFDMQNKGTAITAALQIDAQTAGTNAYAIKVDGGKSLLSGPITTTGNNTHTGTETFANINNRIFADQQSGADACAKIKTAWGLVPSTGGFVDAIGFQGSQTCGSNPFASVTSTGRLELGGTQFQTTASWVPNQGMIIRGLGRGNTAGPTYGTTVIKAVAGFPASISVIAFGANGFGNRVEDIQLDCNNQSGAIGIQNSTGQEQAGVRNVGIINCPAIGLDIESASQNSGGYQDLEVLATAVNCSNCNASTLGIKINNIGSPINMDRLTVNMNTVSPEPNVCVEIDNPGTYNIRHVEECVTGVQVNSGNVTLNGVQCSSVNAFPMTNCVKVAAGLQNVVINNLSAQTGGSFTVTNLLNNLTTGSVYVTTTEGGGLARYQMDNASPPGECSSSAFHACTIRTPILVGASSVAAAGRFKFADQGTCTMAAGTCTAQTLGSTYAAAPNCVVTWTGTGTLTGILKAPSTTGAVTPASTVNTDTAVVNWVCFGN